MKPLSRRNWVTALTLTGAVSCGSPQVGSSPAPKTQATTPAVNAPTQTTEGAKSGLPQSVVSPTVRVSKAERWADSEATVTARLDASAFTYLSVSLNAKDAVRLSEVSYFDFLRVKCEPSPNCLGVRFYPKPASSESEITLLVRTPRTAPATRPNGIVLQTTGRKTDREQSVNGGIEQRFVLREQLKNDGKAKHLEADFQESLAQYLEGLAQKEPFVAFASNRIRSRLTPTPEDHRDLPRDAQTELSSLMDFYTGRREIILALQTERALGVVHQKLQPTVALSTIPGVTATERDYAALIAADRTLGSPRYAPLSNVLPADSIVIEFATVKDLVQLPRIFDERFDAITRVLEEQPGSYRLVERYREQLIVEPSKLSEQLGHVAVGAVALVIGDPYLREGTDMSLVFEVRERALIETVLGKYRFDAKVKFPSLETKSIQLEGTTVSFTGTPDGRVRQYLAWSGERLWISNSPKRLTQLLRISQGKGKSLMETADYRWARRVSPFDATQERAHLFFGDAFMTSITGPRSKILEARRTRAQNELRTVDYAALLHGIMTGTPAQTQKELLTSGWLTHKDLVHFDGSPIAWTRESGASSGWGHASELIPVMDLTMDKVDPSEAKAYAAFRTDYEGQVRGALDPTSLRVLRSESETELRTELRILPLLPSEKMARKFRELVDHVGRGSVEAGTATDGLSAILAISPQSPLRELAQDLLHGSGMTRQLALGFLGDWVKVGLAEDPIVLEGAMEEGLIPKVATPPTETPRPRVDLEDNLQLLPAWAMIQIKSNLMLTATLAAIRVTTDEQLKDMVTWSTDGKYRDVSVGKVALGSPHEAKAVATVYYATVKDTFLLSLQRHVLELRIDDVFAGNRPKATPVDSKSRQLFLDWSKKPGSILSTLVSGMLEMSALRAQTRACAGLSVLALGFGEQTVNDDDGTLGLRYLGYEPLSPNGPGLKMREGLCVHPVYGSALEPGLPAAQDATVPLHRAIEQLRRVRFGLGAVPRKAEQEFFGTVDVSFE